MRTAISIMEEVQVFHRVWRCEGLRVEHENSYHGGSPGAPHILKMWKTESGTWEQLSVSWRKSRCSTRSEDVKEWQWNTRTAAEKVLSVLWTLKSWTPGSGRRSSMLTKFACFKCLKMWRIENGTEHSSWYKDQVFYTSKNVTNWKWNRTQLLIKRLDVLHGIKMQRTKWNTTQLHWVQSPHWRTVGQLVEVQQALQYKTKQLQYSFQYITFLAQQFGQIQYCNALW